MSNKKGFTLVELIVVITILAILGTIAFLSFQGYSKSSRDSVRVSDINVVKKSLEIFSIQTGKYPIPTNPTDFTYSGATVWQQGTFGDSVLNQVEKLNKLPKDPLSEVEYTYSVTNTQKEFEIGSIFEGDIVAQILGETYALGTREATAYITGNYNGLLTKVSTGGTIYILAVPSIISRNLLETDISNLITANELVFNGYANLPSSYVNSVFNIEGGFVNNQTQIEIYSGTDLPEQSDLELFIQNLESAYSGTLLADTNYIDEVIDANLNGDPDIIAELGAQLVNQKLGGEISVVPSNQLPANGVCGTDNSKNLIETPVNLCAAGNASVVTDNGEGSTFEWNCNGISGGTSLSCSANHIANPFTFDENTGTITGYTGGPDVFIPSSINGTAVVAIGVSAFEGKSINSVELPNSLITIGDKAFKSNGITSLVIPNSVQTIGLSAFHFNGLTTLTVPGNVTYIGKHAFQQNSIHTLVLEEGVERIIDYGFLLNQLTSITLPSSLISIGFEAFYSQGGGKGTIYGPASGATYNAYNDSNSVFDEANLAYRYSCNDGTCLSPEYVFSEIGGVIYDYDPVAGGTYSPSIPSSIGGITVSEIGVSAFEGKLLTGVSIPNSVTTIGVEAFKSNDIATLTIPNSVTSIGTESFRNNDIESLTLPNAITSIGSLAFHTNNLTNVTIPDGVTTIGGNSFQLNQLTNLVLPDSISSIGNYAFTHQGGSGLVVTGPPSPHYVRNTWDNIADKFDKDGGANYTDN